MRSNSPVVSLPGSVQRPAIVPKIVAKSIEITAADSSDEGISLPHAARDGHRHGNTHQPGERVWEQSSRYKAGEAPEIHHLAVPQFSFSDFAKQLLYHVVNPFSLLFILPLDGLNMAYNSAFLPADAAGPTIFIFVMNYAISIAVLAVDAIYIYLRVTNTRTELFLFEILALNLVHLIRLITIAVKYGYHLSDPWWRERLLGHRIGTREISSMLLSEWLSPGRHTIERELRIAAERIGERLESRYFAHAEDTGKILKVRTGYSKEGYSLPSENDEVAFDGEIKQQPQIAKRHITMSNFTVHDFAANTITKAGSLPTPISLAPYFSLAFGLIPVVYRFAHRIVRLSTLDTVAVVLCTIFTAFLMNALLTFLITSYADYRRRSMSMIALTLCISDNLRDHAAVLLQKKHSLSTAEKFVRDIDLPVVDMTIPANVSHWLVLHDVFQAFGFEFKKRISAYNTITSTLIIVIIAVLLAQLLADFESVTTISIIYSLSFSALLGLFLVLMAGRGVEANSQFIRQRMCLSSLKVRIQHAMSEMPKHIVTYRRLKDATRLIDTAITSVTFQEQFNPVTVLGIRASGASVRGFIGVLFSLLAFVIQLIFSKRA